MCVAWSCRMNVIWELCTGSYTINISTVVMLGFWLCQFNTNILCWGLCLSSSTKFFVWLIKFNICNLG